MLFTNLQTVVGKAVLILMLASSTVAMADGEPKRGFLARITYYVDHQTASGAEPVQGDTVAAERAFKFGTKFYIPDLKKKVGGNGVFIVQDRGPWVQARKASRGKLPVIDVYVSSRAQLKALTKHKDNVFRVYKK